MTIVLATNIPEGLESCGDQVLLLHDGRQLAFSPLKEFSMEGAGFADAVASKLEQT
jgi:ABC-type multidrug transport system ATPase subunit